MTRECFDDSQLLPSINYSKGRTDIRYQKRGSPPSLKLRRDAVMSFNKRRHKRTNQKPHEGGF